MRDVVQTQNAADPEQVARGGRKERRRDSARFNLLATQLGTYPGREFVWSLFDGLDDIAYGGPADQVMFFLGERKRPSELRAEIRRFHPEAWLLMDREALERGTREQRELGAQSAQRTVET